MAQYTLDHLKYDGSNDIWEVTDSAARGSLAAAYSASSTYAVGDIVLKDGQLYRCNTAITTAEAWTAAHWTAVTVGEKIADLEDDTNQLKEDLSSKAEIDGYYEDMTVGDAEQLVASQYVEDSVPYNFRTTGGSADVGNREYVDAVVGGTVCLNQLAPTYSKAGNGTVPFARGTAITKGHKVFMSYKRDSNTAASFLGIYANEAGTAMNFSLGLESGDALSGATIKNAPASGVSNGTGSNVDGNAWIYQQSEPTITDLMITDLTATFGPTIADYVYGLETATVGAGVAWLKEHFPKIFNSGYIPYNPGELVSVAGVSEKRNTGFNQWDEVYEAGGINSSGQNETFSGRYRSKNYIPVLPSTAYYHNALMAIYYYDADKNYISAISGGFLSAREFTTLSNARYIRFMTNGELSDICINLSDPARNGEYEPYEEHVYPLDPSQTLRGIPKLDSNNRLYYDGDEYLPDGTVNRRYGVVDLGTLTWTTAPSGRHNAVLPNAKGTDNISIGNILCERYITVAGNTVANVDKTIAHINGVTIQVNDSTFNGTDAASFKTAMSGVYIVYELATPTTETAEPYQQIQIIDANGTEEFVSTSVVPVGHEIKYVPNLRAKLEKSPDSPVSDGVYIVQRSNGVNTYVPLASSTTIQDILNRLTALEGA